AEAGIRGGHVTGVQTCALPIFRGVAELASTELAEREHGEAARSGINNCERLPQARLCDRGELLAHPERVERAREIGQADPQDVRSEERRVGKETRARWSPEQ